MIAAPSHTRPPAPKQSGAVLFVALIFLLILTLLGVMLARTQTTDERMAQNDGNHELAVEAAETALRYAESNLSEGLYSNFSADANGLYELDPSVGSVYTPGFNWSATGSVLTYGGATLASVSQAPQFIIEELPAAAIGGYNLNIGGGYGGNGNVAVYQITAHATGGDQTGNATLRSIYEVQE